MPTFLNYWQTLADDLGEFMTFAATSASVSATSTSEIISTALIDSSVGSDRYKDGFVYALDGALIGVQRVVAALGFDAATGTLSVTRPFATTPASGVNWAYTDRFPVIRQDKQPGLRDFINRALREIAVDDVITITGVTDQIRYQLSTDTNWWILEPGRVLSIQNTPADRTERVRTYDYIDKMYFDGEKPILQLRAAYYKTGDTFDLVVKRPANSWLNLDGAWAGQTSPTVGLTDDADQALPPIVDVVTIAKVHAYRSILERPGLSDSRSYWEAKLRDAENDAGLITFSRQKPVEPYHLNMTTGFDIGAFR